MSDSNVNDERALCCASLTPSFPFPGAQAPPPAKKGRRAKEKEPEGEEIPVNSIVVAAKSAVLRAMLSNGMKESAKGAPIIIRVTEQGQTPITFIRYFIQLNIRLWLSLSSDRVSKNSPSFSVLAGRAGRFRGILLWRTKPFHLANFARTSVQDKPLLRSMLVWMWKQFVSNIF